MFVRNVSQIAQARYYVHMAEDFSKTLFTEPVAHDVKIERALLGIDRSIEYPNVGRVSALQKSILDAGKGPRFDAILKESFAGLARLTRIGDVTPDDAPESGIFQPGLLSQTTLRNMQRVFLCTSAGFTQDDFRAANINHHVSLSIDGKKVSYYLTDVLTKKGTEFLNRTRQLRRTFPLRNIFVYKDNKYADIQHIADEITGRTGISWQHFLSAEHEPGIFTDAKRSLQPAKGVRYSDVTVIRLVHHILIEKNVRKTSEKYRVSDVYIRQLMSGSIHTLSDALVEHLCGVLNIKNQRKKKP